MNSNAALTHILALSMLLLRSSHGRGSVAPPNGSAPNAKQLQMHALQNTEFNTHINTHVQHSGYFSLPVNHHRHRVVRVDQYATPWPLAISDIRSIDRLYSIGILLNLVEPDVARVARRSPAGHWLSASVGIYYQTQSIACQLRVRSKVHSLTTCTAAALQYCQILPVNNSKPLPQSKSRRNDSKAKATNECELSVKNHTALKLVG